MNVRGCLSKHRFGSMADAEAKKNSIWFERGVALRAYECHECGGYHLTKDRAVAPVGRNFGPPKRPSNERERRRVKRRRNRG